MESQTKTKQSKETIEKMVKKIFPSSAMTDYKELTEGYFNVAYEVQLNGDTDVILKIAPDNNMRVMTNEKNIMLNEVTTMQTVSKYDGIKAPKVLGSDFSCTICNAPYFFMEKLTGKSLNSIKDTLSQEIINQVYWETGNMIRQVNEITCPCFGYPAQEEFQGKEWFPIFRKMIQANIADAKRGNVDTKISADNLLEHLEQDRALFEEITVPKLVHWDAWDGNIFVQDGHVTGLIDWERSLWADPLLEVGFRTYEQDKQYYFKGYGIEKLTENQYRRALWYDIYFMSTAVLECEYRRYETMDMYNWSVKMLQEQFSKL